MRAWRSLRVEYVALDGATTNESLWFGSSITFVDKDGVASMRLSMPEPGLVRVEQLQPTLALDKQTMEWAAKQVAK